MAVVVVRLVLAVALLAVGWGHRHDGSTRTTTRGEPAMGKHDDKSDEDTATQPHKPQGGGSGGSNPDGPDGGKHGGGK